MTCFPTEDIKDTMETSYACIFPETFKMKSIFLALPIGTASEEGSFSDLKMAEKDMKCMQWNWRKYWRFVKNITIEYT